MSLKRKAPKPAADTPDAGGKERRGKAKRRAAAEPQVGAPSLPADTKDEADSGEAAGSSDRPQPPPCRTVEQLGAVLPNETLFALDTLDGVYQCLAKLCDEGRLTAKERRLMLKRWQCRQRIKNIYAQAKIRKKEEKAEASSASGKKAKRKNAGGDEPIEQWIREHIADAADVDEVKRRLNELSAGGRLPAGRVGAVVSKWKKSEWRRQRRSHNRAANKLCFSCRQPGHALADCPSAGDEHVGGAAAGICFKCGSTEHSAHACSSKVTGYPYASCFVCGESGHLSRDCGRNPHGAFPMGGGCNLCGDKSHLRKDCPLPHAKGDKPEVRLRAAADAGANPDLDEPPPAEENGEQEETQPRAKRRKPKVVKF